jgi:hypothetical protein
MNRGRHPPKWSVNRARDAVARANWLIKKSLKADSSEVEARISLHRGKRSSPRVGWLATKAAGKGTGNRFSAAARKARITLAPITAFGKKVLDE